MPILLRSVHSAHPSVDTKLRTLREILYDINRNEQSPRSPVNMKGLKGELQNRYHIKDIRHYAKKSGLMDRCNNYYRNLMNKSDNITPPGLGKLKREVISNQYTRLKKIDLKSLADAKIDREYEMLQQKYFPNFKLGYETTPIKFTRKKAMSTKPVLVCNRLTCKISSRKFQSTRKAVATKKSLNENNTKCIEQLFVKNKTEENESSDNSEKTLTPEQTIMETVVKVKDKKRPLFKAAEPKKQQSSATKYRGPLPKTVVAAARSSKNSIREIDCSVIKNIFYHKDDFKATSASSCKLKDHQMYIKNEIQQAIRLGKSTDPLINSLLANAIERAQNERVAWPVVKSIIENCKDYNNRKKVLHLLQIHLEPGIFILCTVKTCKFTKLIWTLDKEMHPLKARFAPVLQHFTHCCVIEAKLPQHCRKFNEKQLRQYLAMDSFSLNAKKIDVVDPARSEVSIECLPVSMPNVSKILADKGYKILNSDYGFRANQQIILDTKSSSNYRKLMKILLDIPDVEAVSDNVLN